MYNVLCTMYIVLCHINTKLYNWDDIKPWIAVEHNSTFPEYKVLILYQRIPHDHYLVRSAISLAGYLPTNYSRVADVVYSRCSVCIKEC